MFVLEPDNGYPINLELRCTWKRIMDVSQFTLVCSVGSLSDGYGFDLVPETELLMWLHGVDD